MHCNSFMYADDLILLSISLNDLQCMIDLCVVEFEAIGMNINAQKSSCIRIGPRHLADVNMLNINNQPLCWKQELLYLGIVIQGGKCFHINLQKLKQKFYCTLNGIFGKVGMNTQPVVLVSLIHSTCVPVLLYGADAVNLTTKMTAGIENAYSHAYMKIFKTFDKNVVSQCQFYMKKLPMDHGDWSKDIDIFK